MARPRRARTAEQRQLRRVTASVEVRVVSRAAPLGQTVDISLDGLFVRTDERPAIGTALSLTLVFPNVGSLGVSARVVRATPEGIGLKLLDEGGADRRALRRVMVRYTRAAGSRETALRMHATSEIQRTLVDDAAEIGRILEVATIDRAKLSIVSDGETEIVDAALVGFEEGELRLRAEEAPHLRTGEDVWVLCTLAFVSYSFQSRVESISSQSIFLRAPVRLVHSDRREGERIPVLDHWVEIPGAVPPARWRVVDRSEGGLALADDGHDPRLAPGEALLGARLVGPHGVLVLDGAVIRSVRLVERPSGGVTRLVGLAYGAARAPLGVAEAGPVSRGWAAQTAARLRAAVAFVELPFRSRELAHPSGALALPEVLSIPGRRGAPIVGLLQQTASGPTAEAAPLVVVVPGFGGRKEQMSYLASILMETFRAAGEPLAVLRVDGTNNLGESGKDAGCGGEGRHTLHYTIGGVVADMEAVLRWARDNDRVRPSTIILVSVSFASCAVMRWLSAGRAPEVSLWISYMGAADVRDAVLHVSGHFDLHAAAASGRPLGTITLAGCMVDANRFWEDLSPVGGGTLQESRREMAKIGAEILWFGGTHDAFMDLARVRDILSVAAPGPRTLIEADSGHVPRTGDEAIRQFQRIAGETFLRLHHRRPRPASLSLAALEARARWEWARTRRAGLPDPVEFWRGYLLGAGGYDVMSFMPAYREFVALQVDQLPDGAARVLDVGAGTGNVTCAILARGVPWVTAVDFVPDALNAIAAKAERAGHAAPEALLVDLGGSPRMAIRRWLADDHQSYAEVARRLPGFPSSLAQRLDAAADAGLDAVLRGGEGDLSAWHTFLGLAPYELGMLEDLRRLARWAGGLAPGPKLESLGDEVVEGPCGLPVATASFDAAVASLLLSYLPFPEDLLHELHRAVRPGGVVVLSSMRRDADTSSLFAGMIAALRDATALGGEERRGALLLEAEAFHSRGAALFRMEEEGLFRFYTAEELAAMAVAAGFVPVRSFASFGVPAQAVVVVCARP